MARKLIKIGLAVRRLFGSNFDENKVEEIEAHNNALKTYISDLHNKPAQFSAFGLLKTANESVIADYRFNTRNLANQWDTTLTGLGSTSIIDSLTGVQLNTGAAATSKAQIDSVNPHYYQAGRGQLIKFSTILSDVGVAGNVREWGIGDDDNGFFFRQDGTTLKIIILNDGNEIEVDSDSWDIPTTCDENGHIYYIQFEWLGVGNVYFYYDEQIVHTYNFVGTSTGFSIQTPDLKVRIRNENTTNDTDVSLKVGCVSVVMEGGNLISGITPNGIIKQAGVDPSGRLYVSTENDDAISIEVVYDREFNINENNYFYTGLTYTTPIDYKFIVTQVTSTSTDNKTIVKVDQFTSFGLYDPNAEIFTPGDTIESPDFASGIDLFVSQDMGNVDDILFTVDYTNQDGVTGRTATAKNDTKIKKNVVAGFKIEMVLQAGDYGVLSVQGLTGDNTNTGQIQVQGIKNFFYQKVSDAGAVYNLTVPRETVIIYEGGKLNIDLGTAGAGTATRMARVGGILVPIR